MKSLVTVGTILAVAAVVPASASEPAGTKFGAGLVRTDRLSKCLQGAQDLDDFPEGEAPFTIAGIKLNAKDGQRGRSIRFCFRVARDLDNPPDSSAPVGHGRIRFPKGHWMHRNAESLKVIGELCDVTLFHRNKAGKVAWGGRGVGHSAQRAIFEPRRDEGQTTYRKKVEIVRRWDDRFWGLHWDVDCN